MRYLALAAIGLLACGCAAPPHNYAGSAGSVYDKAQQPPHEFPQSAYDPHGPVKEQDFGNGGYPAGRATAP